MPRDRFELMFWLFHVSHSTSARARIDKMKMLLDKMLAHFKATARSLANAWTFRPFCFPEF